MSEIRVFELAKEFNLPAKQMVQQLRKGGIAVEKPFDTLTEEQLKQARKLMKSPEEKAAKPSKTRSVRRVISTRRSAEPEPEEETPEDAGEEKPRIITVTAKNLQNMGEDERPRRIRRRIKEDAAEAPESEPAAEASSGEEEVAAAAPEAKVKVKAAETPVAEASVKVKAHAEASAPEPPAEASKAAPKTPEPAPTKVKAKAPESAPVKAKVASVTPTPETAPTISRKGAATPSTTVEEPSVERSRSEDRPKPDRREQPRSLDARPDRKSGKSSKQSVEEEEEASLRKSAGKKRQFRDYYSSEESDNQRRRRKDRGKGGKTRRGGFDLEEAPKHTFNPRRKSIKVGSQATVSELASLLGVKVTELMKTLMGMGIMATMNQTIPGETAVLLAAEFNIEVEFESYELEDLVKEEDPEEQHLETRAPIVTIMGHVDHGKTSLLDKIRSTQIADREAGGITQHIGAYHVETEGLNITFLDTPGHQAFSAMRARGATVTDIVVLVVAADDRVQPQTIEAINHAKAAEVPIIVAVNKVDRPEADPNRIRQDLLSYELVPEEYGGSTIFVDVSAKTGQGLDQLLEMIQLQAEVLELQSTAEGNARGTIIESRISRGQGAVATVLVQRGTLRIGDFFVVGSTFGRVRSMSNDLGQAIKEATPGLPAEISGLNEVPEAGEQVVVLEDEKAARQLADQRQQRQREQVLATQQKASLENLFDQMAEGEQIELRLLVKSDVQGSAEALQNAIQQLSNEKIAVRFMHAGVGNITETDVTLASASDAIIIGFNVQIDARGKEARSREGVDVRLYNVIYDAIDDVRAAMEGMLAPEIREQVVGHCEVRAVFNSVKQGTVFGAFVTDGKIFRNALARVLRNEQVVYNGSVSSLKRFKDDVREVVQNYECGIVMDFPEVEVGDVVEVYERVEEAAKL